MACKCKPIQKDTASPATATQRIAVFSPRVSRTHAVMCSLQCSQTLVILGVMNFTVAVTRCVGKVWRGLQVCVQVTYRNIWFVWLQTLPRCRGDVYARDTCEQALNLSVPWLFRRRQVGLVLQEWCGIAFPLNLLCSILIYRHISGSYATHQEHWSDACALRYKVRQCWWYAEVFICVNDFSASCLILFLFFHTPYCFSPSTLLDRHT